jgi:hypothetical protein
MDSVTFTNEEGEDLARVVRYAIEHGIGYGHVLPGSPEYEQAEQARKVLLGKIERPLLRAQKREAFRARKAR